MPATSRLAAALALASNALAGSYAFDGCWQEPAALTLDGGAAVTLTPRSAPAAP